MAKVVRMFGRGARGRESEERRSRMRSTAYVSGQDMGGVRGETPKSAAGAEVADDRARALACLVLDHREGLGLSQREFARESGISRATLSKIEQGRLYPGGRVRRKLAAFMGLSPMDLWRIGQDNSADEAHNHQKSSTNQDQHTHNRKAS